MGNLAEVMDQLPPGPVTVRDLCRACGAPYKGIRKGIEEGLISQDSRIGRQGSTMSRADALLVISAVALAALVGIAFLTALRVMRNGGARLDGAVIVIPLGGC